MRLIGKKYNPFHSCYLTTTLLLFSTFSLPVISASWIEDNFIDSQDGYLDMSQWLGSKQGFLPVPLIITEPAIGTGAGLAMVYFHDQFTGRKGADGSVRKVPPSVSVVSGAKTTNDTYFIGGGHVGIWKNDDIRYAGFIGNASLNLDYSGRGNSELNRDPLRFNLNSFFFLQKLMFRIRDSDFFMGGQYLLVDSESEFDMNLDDILGMPEIQSDSKATAMGFIASYDSRDNAFYPQKGTKSEIKAMIFDENFGGDENFNSYRAKLINFSKPHPDLILGLRLDANAVSGNAPFYFYPFINMRGIPIMRYQGEETLLGEVELNWLVHPRWNILFFSGVGKAFNDGEYSEDSDTLNTIGSGFRYNMARKLGLTVGLDLVAGPEENAIYFSFGSGLMR